MTVDCLAKISLLTLLVSGIAGCGQALPPELKADPSTVAAIRTKLAEGVTASDDSSSESAAQPTGFATLRGKITLVGDAPAPAQLQITKDQDVCAPGGKTVYSNSLVVDAATKGIKNFLIYADKVPEGWVHDSAKPGNTDEVIFDQKECIFLTHVVAIQTTQKLKVLNSDPVGHNLMVGSFNQTIPSGGNATYQPNKEQRNPLKASCAVHPWMEAWFINRDNAYFAVTAEDGSFEIANLPAGVPLEFRAWHEKLAGNISLELNGQQTTWSKGKFTLTLEPDGTVELNAGIDGSQFQ